MKRFRHWFFKVLTGYDIVEYSELLQLTREVVKDAQEANAVAQEILALNEKVLQSNQAALDTAAETSEICRMAIDNCRAILRVCGKEDENETLDG